MAWWTSIVQALQSRLAPTSKFRQVQVRGRVTDGTDGVTEAGWGQVWTGWWCCAPPFPPKADSAGVIREACEYLSVDLGDDQALIGSRDVRFARILGDLQGGEVGICNAFGARLVLTQKAISLLAGGAFLNFDIDTKKVGITGFPARAGEGAAVISLTTTGVGLLSASGKASVTIDGDALTFSGASCAIDAGRIDLGSMATNPVVGQAAFQQFATEVIAAIKALAAFATTHVHPTPAGPSSKAEPAPVVPSVSPPVPGTRVFIPL